MGVMQGKSGQDGEGNIDETTIFNENTLLITQTMQKSNKAHMSDLW